MPPLPLNSSRHDASLTRLVWPVGRRQEPPVQEPLRQPAPLLALRLASCSRPIVPQGLLAAAQRRAAVQPLPAAALPQAVRAAQALEPTPRMPAPGSKPPCQ